MYPEWREVLPIIKVVDLEGSVCMNVFDATKMGKDVLIGTAVLPISLLLDQLVHTFWIKINVPGVLI